MRTEGLAVIRRAAQPDVSKVNSKGGIDKIVGNIGLNTLVDIGLLTGSEGTTGKEYHQVDKRGNHIIGMRQRIDYSYWIAKGGNSAMADQMHVTKRRHPPPTIWRDKAARPLPSKTRELASGAARLV